MLGIIQSGGWMMLAIILCSIVAMAIICERFWSLDKKKILPPDLAPKICQLAHDKQLDDAVIRKLKDSSPLGAVLSVGLLNTRHNRVIMKESIEEVGRQVAHQLEKYLNFLGTIATITPLLGLLGTVIGMINVFSAIMLHGVGDLSKLAGGISEALLTTAAGLTVAIPSLIFHRYFERRVDGLVLNMEEESLKLIEIVYSNCEQNWQ